MSHANYYETLDISIQATPTEIKQAYRRLAKLFHPDRQNTSIDPEKIIQINAAYEVLGDPQRRRSYDQQLRVPWLQPRRSNRQQRAADAQQQYRRYRESTKDTDVQVHEWLQHVYKPVNQFISPILNVLDEQIDQLAADPFDDELMAQFQDYIENCRHYLNQAQLTFRSQPNPALVAGAAASLYYCLNQLGDGIDELERFTFNYDEHYLHTGQELFRIATGLRCEAREALRGIV
ncbi:MULTISPECIES: J domain-containing protein [unclassified Coleofasciculus]|uniref:J domain-containing protein n=1 Tax=unclassified Coleofasciculus TaxID=2692782 RepID=UPI00187FFAAA|nr:MULTISPECIES: J domain-containing protein [unclassified Coleofasciculus]MBE9128066.1 J domain-containing protein [Coleofasciculus sp. LEGE 07081]MBE9149331.1 J domain-containing protein [Coleofasciculus sp. LEGE 07092]